MHTIPAARRLALAVLIAATTSPLLTGCASAQPVEAPQIAPARVCAPGSASGVDGTAASTVPTPDPAPGDTSEWSYHALAFLWVPGIKGKAGKGDAVSKSDLSVSDTADVLKNSLERALLTHVEARTDGWGLFGEVVALKLEDDSSTTTVVGPVRLPNGRVVAPRRSIDVDTEATLEMTVIEAGATIDLTGDLVPDEYTDARIEALVGARYYDVQLDLQVNNQRLTDDGGDWVDSFVGARASLLLDGEWDVIVRGDVGGFGIGSSSDSAWRATGVVRYRPWNRVAVFAGWNVLSIDKERGSGVNEQVFNMRLSGPILGFTYDF